MAHLARSLNQLVPSCLALFLLACTAHGDEIHKLIESGQIDEAKALLAKDPKLLHALDDSWQTP